VGFSIVHMQRESGEEDAEEEETQKVKVEEEREEG
jgi:hypothetical protein